MEKVTLMMKEYREGYYFIKTFYNNKEQGQQIFPPFVLLHRYTKIRAI